LVKLIRWDDAPHLHHQPMDSLPRWTGFRVFREPSEFDTANAKLE
jgi:hypothetical protein